LVQYLLMKKLRYDTLRAEERESTHE